MNVERLLCQYEGLFFRDYGSGLRVRHVHRVRNIYWPKDKAEHIPMRDLGREFSRYIAGEECPDWLDFAKSFGANLRSDDLRRTLLLIADGQGVTITLCAGCKSVFIDDDCQYSHTHNGRVCADCAEDHVTTEDTGKFLSVEDCTAAYTRYEYPRFIDTAYFESGNSLCELALGDLCQYATRDAVNQSHWYCWVSDGCYHEDPDPYDGDDDDDCSNGIYEIDV